MIRPIISSAPGTIFDFHNFLRKKRFRARETVFIYILMVYLGVF